MIIMLNEGDKRGEVEAKFLIRAQVEVELTYPNGHVEYIDVPEPGNMIVLETDSPATAVKKLERMRAAANPHYERMEEDTRREIVRAISKSAFETALGNFPSSQWLPLWHPF